MTDQLANSQVVALAVYQLGGEERAVDTEDVAVKANELAPGRFLWLKYPDQINLELVRVSLSDAKKKSNGSLIAGSGKEGWTLTPRGRRWAHRAMDLLSTMDLSKKVFDQERGSVDARRVQRERRRILGTPAWKRWASGDKSVPVAEIKAVFRIDHYATERTRSLKINRLLRLFNDDSEVRPFIEALSRSLSTEAEV